MNRDRNNYNEVNESSYEMATNSYESYHNDND